MISRQLMAASTRPIILAILSGEEDYGYSIIQKVRSGSAGALEWTDGMLYPVLQRMEMDGLLASRWKGGGDNRPRRYYRITERGREELVEEMAGWKSVSRVLARFSVALAARG